MSLDVLTGTALRVEEDPDGAVRVYLEDGDGPVDAEMAALSEFYEIFWGEGPLLADDDTFYFEGVLLDGPEA